MQWHYTQNGTQLGPVSEAEIKALIQSQQLRLSDLVWKEGMGEWKSISDVPELAGGGAALSSAAPSAPAAPQSPYQPPAARVQPANQAAMQNIPTYLWQSILVTLLCCLPAGIVAIVYASKVDGLKMAGDIAGAQEASNKAKNWVNLSVIFSLVVGVLYFILGAASA